MSLFVALRLKYKGKPRQAVARAATIIPVISRRRRLAAASVDSWRSRNGCNSSMISSGRRENAERPPAIQGCKVNAAKSTANGGQYSAVRFQRAVITISTVENNK